MELMRRVAQARPTRRLVLFAAELPGNIGGRVSRALDEVLCGRLHPDRRTADRQTVMNLVLCIEDGRRYRGNPEQPLSVRDRVALTPDLGELLEHIGLRAFCLASNGADDRRQLRF